LGSSGVLQYVGQEVVDDGEYIVEWVTQPFP
jgi:hypothetical protein